MKPPLRIIELCNRLVSTGSTRKDWEFHEIADFIFELAEAPSPQPSPPGEGELARITSRCPSCHNNTLVNNSGYLLCAWRECKDPTLIHRLGEMEIELAPSPENRESEHWIERLPEKLLVLMIARKALIFTSSGWEPDFLRETLCEVNALKAEAARRGIKL